MVENVNYNWFCFGFGVYIEVGGVNSLFVRLVFVIIRLFWREDKNCIGLENSCMVREKILIIWSCIEFV